MVDKLLNKDFVCVYIAGYHIDILFYLFCRMRAKIILKYATIIHSILIINGLYA